MVPWHQSNSWLDKSCKILGVGIRKACKESSRTIMCHYTISETAVCYRTTANGIDCCDVCEGRFPFVCHHFYLPVIVVSCLHGFIYYLRKYFSDQNYIAFFWLVWFYVWLFSCCLFCFVLLLFVFQSRQIVRVPRNKKYRVIAFILVFQYTKCFLNWHDKIMSASIVMVKLILTKPLEALVTV